MKILPIRRQAGRQNHRGIYQPGLAQTLADFEPLDESGLPPEAIAAIRHGNAARLFPRFA